jgi:SAM-dependent methyltransferase
VLPDPGGFFQLFYERRHEVARELLNGDRSTALDVGCGGGFLRSIGLTNIIGIDVRVTGAVTVRASAENLPFRDQVFDLVFAGEVLEHLNCPPKPSTIGFEYFEMARSWSFLLRMDVSWDWKETLQNTDTFSPQGTSGDHW